jgi:hypothetical protein
MSRAERRAYKRMTKNQDPMAPPGGSRAARSRVEKQRARRSARRPTPTEQQFVAGRFWLWGVGGAAVAGLLGFSLAWPSGMPFALYVGLAVAAGWAGLAAGFRYLQRRAAQR